MDSKPPFLLRPGAPAQVFVEGLEHLGRAAASVQRLAQLGREALDDPRGTLRWARFSPVAYPTSNIVTERLTHCRLGFADGREARIFVKEIRDVNHWPLLHLIPEHLLESFVTEFPWQVEVVAYTTGLGCELPQGLRLPRIHAIHAIHELSRGRAAIWMEDIRQTCGPVWDRQRFAHAARLLGRLAARRRPDLVPPLCDSPGGLAGPNSSMRMMFGGRIDNLFRPAIESDELWKHPTVVARSTAPVTAASSPTYADASEAAGS